MICHFSKGDLFLADWGLHFGYIHLRVKPDQYPVLTCCYLTSLVCMRLWSQFSLLKGVESQIDRPKHTAKHQPAYGAVAQMLKLSHLSDADWLDAIPSTLQTLLIAVAQTARGWLLGGKQIPLVFVYTVGLCLQMNIHTSQAQQCSQMSMMQLQICAQSQLSSTFKFNKEQGKRLINPSIHGKIMCTSACILQKFWRWCTIKTIQVITKKWNKQLTDISANSCIELRDSFFHNEKHIRTLTKGIGQKWPRPSKNAESGFISTNPPPLKHDDFGTSTPRSLCHWWEEAARLFEPSTPTHTSTRAVCRRQKSFK